MVLAGLIVEFVFGGLGLIPEDRSTQVLSATPQWNYTTYLNIVFLALAAVLVVRFFRSGGGPMLAMMNGGPDDHAHHDHGHDEHGQDEHGQDEHGQDEHGQDEHGHGHHEHGHPVR
jgi:hypothetical protein